MRPARSGPTTPSKPLAPFRHPTFRAIRIANLARSVGPALGGALVAGGGWVARLASLNVTMQLRSPEEILGRCMAIYQAMTFGGMALGAYAIGLLSDLIGVAAAIRVAAAVLLVLLPLLHRLAAMPGPGEGRSNA